MAITTCTVSGTIKNISNAAITNATIRAYITTPFFHTDGTWIGAYEVTATPDGTGAWTLTLIETTSVSKTITVVFDYQGGTADRKRREYVITVPVTATANFSDLANDAN